MAKFCTIYPAGLIFLLGLILIAECVPASVMLDTKDPTKKGELMDIKLYKLFITY